MLHHPLNLFRGYQCALQPQRLVADVQQYIAFGAEGCGVFVVEDQQRLPTGGHTKGDMRRKVTKKTPGDDAAVNS